MRQRQPLAVILLANELRTERWGALGYSGKNPEGKRGRFPCGKLSAWVRRRER
jgi:hypothetical protein